MSDVVRISKFLSLVLRHQPQKIGIELDEAGWVEVDRLLEACRRHGRSFSRETLHRVVTENDKQRYRFSDDGLRIRAVQGHSVPVLLEYLPQQPPDLLYHGTVERFLESIFAQGLIRGTRTHVHLSADVATANKVGSRRGKPVILEVAAGAMHQAGHAFLLADNGVWLTAAVPAEYLRRSS